MATHHLPAVIFNGRPTSPPMTPGSRARYCLHVNDAPPFHTHKSAPKFAHTPPLEFIEPIGEGHHFNFTRPQSFAPSSRASTNSGRVFATTPILQDSDDEDQSEAESDQESDDSDDLNEDRSFQSPSDEDDLDADNDADNTDDDEQVEEKTPLRRVEIADFELEEMDNSHSSHSPDSDIEVVQPDNFSSARSSQCGEKLTVINKLKELILEETSSDEEERDRIYRRKKKRWSAGVFKRSHSQSVEGDSSLSDNDPLDDVDPKARRLRRRVRGAFDRASLIFEDKGFANTNNIEEVEEPDEGGVVHSKGPPSIPSDDAFTLDELPFWRASDDSMDVEFDDSEY